ncbi:MAG TPA: hypothetical protein ENL10_04590 [Candidatus Cloacimonetes bacterium]|nr:hypothetical protein [Candidatus Cloacimonadota bacterium]
MRAQKYLMMKKIAEAITDRVVFTKVLYGFPEIAPKQKELLLMDGEINIIVAGRRFGKTTYLAANAFHYAIMNPNTVTLITAPSIDQAKIYFDLIAGALEHNPMDDVIKSDVHPFRMFVKYIKNAPFPELELYNGAKILVRSTAFKGRYLRGRKTNRIYVTEASFVNDEVFHNVIMPMRLDTGAKIFLESTPYGRNYFFELYQEAQKDLTGYYRWFHATVYDNPFLDFDEIERQKKKIPEYVFNQEYMGEFIDDSKAVFSWRILKNVFEDYYPAEYIPSHRYVIGLDIAQVNDYNVFMVLDVTRKPYQIAEIVRFNDTSYEYIIEEANRLSRKYNADIYVDATTVGRPIAEKIKRAVPITLTIKSKSEIIDNLVLLLERKDIILPAKEAVLRDEMKYFRREQSARTVKMGSDSKRVHDDMVIALALAAWGVREDNVFSMSVEL